MSPAGPLAELLGVTVRVGTVRIGEVVGVFVDRAEGRAIGLEVAGAGGTRRFLPWVAARTGAGGIAVDSALLLVDDGSSYERLGALSLRDASKLGRLRATPDATIEEGEPVLLNAATGT